MIRVAVIGCGKIADAHAAAIEHMAEARIVAACDLELLMAQQFAERYAVASTYDDVGAMLERVSPDVVHITTPPQSHFPLAKQCLEANASVYVEKPFTVTAREAEDLIALAERRNLRLTAGHDLQFSPVSCRLRELVEEGYLGGPPVHMESYYCYDLGNAEYARALLTDREHWVRTLPGGLLQNIISHGIARLAEFLTCDDPEVYAYGFVSPSLAELGETGLVDELRVIIRDRSGITAYFTFSSQMRPCYRLFRIFGSKNGAELDEDKQLLIRVPGGAFKSYAEMFLPPLLRMLENLRNLGRNLHGFMKGGLHMKQGMMNLIEKFYLSLDGKAEPPISHREILLTARIMEEIFQQVASQDRDKVGKEADEPVGP
jgi:predicted dehydrogenase